MAEGSHFMNLKIFSDQGFSLDLVAGILIFSLSPKHALFYRLDFIRNFLMQTFC